MFAFNQQECVFFQVIQESLFKLKFRNEKKFWNLGIVKIVKIVKMPFILMRKICKVTKN